MITDLNFYPADEENYTTEEPSGNNFLAGIFSTYDQINFYPNEVQNTISNFNQGGYYPYLAVYSNNIIYQQLNPAVPPYNFFGGSSSISVCNLADDLNLTVFDGNLSLSRTKEKNNINDSSNVDPTVMKLSDDHDDQDEQDDGGPYYWSEIETREDYTEQSNISIDESEK
jgi:hypothetical protein